MAGLDPAIQGDKRLCLRLWMGGLNPPMVNFVMARFMRAIQGNKCRCPVA